MRALAESLQEYVLSSENFLLNIAPQLRRGYDLDIRRGSKITRLQLFLDCSRNRLHCHLNCRAVMSAVVLHGPLL
jgi:hypothetical protein